MTDEIIQRTIITAPISIKAQRPDPGFLASEAYLFETGDKAKLDALSAPDISFNFSYGDATPAALMTASAGKVIYGVQIHITEPFDGVGASLSIGDVGQVDRLMAVNENDPTQVCGNGTTPSFAYDVDTGIQLYITPGAGATTGSGLVIINIEA